MTETLQSSIRRRRSSNRIHKMLLLQL